MFFANAVIAASLLTLHHSFKEKSEYLIIPDSSPVPKDCATPIMIYKGDPLSPTCIFELYAEGELLYKPIDIMQAFSLTLSCYCLFNICYNKDCNSVMTFLQEHTLKLQDKVLIPAGVHSFMNKIM